MTVNETNSKRVRVSILHDHLTQVGSVSLSNLVNDLLEKHLKTGSQAVTNANNKKHQ
jgi:hypothetical protein